MTPAVAYAQPDQLTLRQGDTLRGTMLEITDESYIFDHEQLGELTLRRDEVADVDIDDVFAFELRQAERREAVEEPAEAANFFGDWESRFSLGFSGSEGNSRDQSLNSQLRIQRSDDRHRVRLEAAYFYGRSFGARSTNEARVEGLYDWKFPNSPWFIFLEAGYTYDEFRDWEHRAEAHTGVGYTLYDTDRLEVDIRSGLGGRYDFRGDDKGFVPEAMFGASIFRLNVTENQVLTAQTRLYPNLEDRGEFRWNSSAEYNIKINHANGMRVGFGIDHRYESDPGSDPRRNDLRYFGQVVVDF